MTGEAERGRLLAAYLCGDRVPMPLASIGVRRLPDLTGRDPWDLTHEISLQAGRPIWRAPIAIQALHNRTGTAGREGSRPPAQRRTTCG